MPPYAGHCLGGDHGVDDRFFSGLHRGKKNGVDLIVGQHPKWANTVEEAALGFAVEKAMKMSPEPSPE